MCITNVPRKPESELLVVKESEQHIFMSPSMFMQIGDMTQAMFTFTPIMGRSRLLTLAGMAGELSAIFNSSQDEEDTPIVVGLPCGATYKWDSWKHMPLDDFYCNCGIQIIKWATLEIKYAH